MELLLSVCEAAYQAAVTNIRWLYIDQTSAGRRGHLVVRVVLKVSRPTEVFFYIFNSQNQINVSVDYVLVPFVAVMDCLWHYISEEIEWWCNKSDFLKRLNAFCCLIWTRNCCHCCWLLFSSSFFVVVTSCNCLLYCPFLTSAVSQLPLTVCFLQSSVLMFLPRNAMHPRY